MFKIHEKAKKDKMLWQPPMLASLTHSFFSNPDWLFECKMDGERCLVCSDEKGNIGLYSRSKQVLNNIYPELVAAFQKFKVKNFILDGEIVAFDKKGVTSFSVLQKRIGLRNPSIKEIKDTPVYYYVFDLIYFAGYNLKQVPLIDRKELLKNNISFNQLIIFTKHYVNYGIKYYRYACKKGLEGIIAKNMYSVYQNKRSRDWLKFKCSNEQEFIIIGYTEPKGSRIAIGALLLGYYENKKLFYAGKVGTGFNYDMLLSLKGKLLPLEIKKPVVQKKINEKNIHWVAPKLLCQIKFTEWTVYGKLRHPKFVGLRTDKDPKDVVREKIL